MKGLEICRLALAGVAPLSSCAFVGSPEVSSDGLLELSEDEKVEEGSVEADRDGESLSGKGGIDKEAGHWGGGGELRWKIVG